jgi:hypothetical protein
MTDNIELQARLLEQYLDQLAHEPESAAPDDLDPEIADLTRALQTHLTPPEPAPAFVEKLAATLATEARAHAGATNRRAARTSIEDHSPNSRDADAPSMIARGRNPDVISSQPRSWRRELLGIAAAIVVLALVVGLLAAVFDLHVNPSDNSVPAAQPSPTQRSVAPPATATPSPFPTPAVTPSPTPIPTPTPAPTPTPIPTPTVRAEATVPPPPAGWITASDAAERFVISYPPGWDIQNSDQAGTPIILTSWTMPETGGGGIPDGGIKIDFGPLPLPFPMPSPGSAYAPGVDGHAAVFFIDESLFIASPGSPPPQNSFGGAPHDLIIYYQVGDQAWEFAALSTEPLSAGGPARIIVDQIVSTIHYEP